MKNFFVNEYRFLSVNDDFNSAYHNWSRPYEYSKVISAISRKAASIHNTASGIVPNKIYPYAISQQFAKILNLTFPDACIINSDIMTPLVEDRPFMGTFNYASYNIVTDFPKLPIFEFDAVLCISVIEHLPPTLICKAVENLIDRTKKGGKAIFTFDYPRIDIKMMNNLVGSFCKESKGARLNGANSVYPNPQYKHLNIVYLELEIV